MILYSVHYSGPNTSYEWSIVTIHKSLEGAEEAKAKYERNVRKHRDAIDCEYRIIEIDTDNWDDCIYDYDTIDEDEDIYDEEDDD